MTSADVTTDDDGRAVLVKHAADPAGRAKLEHEAATLQQISHPGVVELLRADLDEPDPTITLGWTPGRTIGQVGVLPPERAAGIVVDVARTVADLHRLKVAHGRLTPDHVLVRDDGSTVVCGWSGAILGADPAEPEAAARARLAQSNDVAGLGELLRILVGPTTLEPIPERRARWRRGPADSRAALLTLADVASHEEVHRRPTALALIDDILAIVPGASLARRSTASAADPQSAKPSDPWTQSVEAPVEVLPVGCRAGIDPSTTLRRRQLAAEAVARPDPRRRWAPAARLIAGLAGAAAIGLAITAVARPSGRSVGAPITTPTETSTPTSTTAARPTTTTTAPATTTAPVVPGCLASAGPDIDGDGCTDVLTVSAGVVAAPSHRYVVGSPEDQVVVADWDCDGVATAALLRARTGEVFVFPDWASPAHPVTVAATAKVGSATILSADDDDHDGCADLVAREPGHPARVLLRTKRP